MYETFLDNNICFLELLLDFCFFEKCFLDHFVSFRRIMNRLLGLSLRSYFPISLISHSEFLVKNFKHLMRFIFTVICFLYKVNFLLSVFSLRQKLLQQLACCLKLVYRSGLSVRQMAQTVCLTVILASISPDSLFSVAFRECI